ncbi:MAG: DUF4142 domain-containing protein [Burkholderiales bacterium]
MNVETLSVLLFAGGLICGAAVAAEKDAESAQTVGKQGWIKQAAQGGLAEVEMGKLAAQKARNPEVKKYGQRMVEDHGKVNDQLMRIAAEKGVTPPSQPAPKQMAKKKELMAASEAEFDKKYMQAQVRDHQEMIALFEQGAKSKDRKLQEFAKKTLPNLKEHLQMARNIQSKIK